MGCLVGNLISIMHVIKSHKFRDIIMSHFDRNIVGKEFKL